MNSLTAAPIITFEREWFVSTDVVQMNSYNWFFEYKKPEIKVEGFKETIQGNKYVDNVDDIITVSYPGTCLMQVMVVKDNKVIHEVDGYKKICFSAGQVKLEIHSEPDNNLLSLVVIMNGSSDTTVFRAQIPAPNPYVHLNGITYAKEDEIDNVHEVKEYHQEGWKDVIVKKIELVRKQPRRKKVKIDGTKFNPLHQMKKYKNIHDNVDVSLFEVVQDLVIVSGAPYDNYIDEISCGVYKMLMPYSSCIERIVTIKYYYIDKFIRLFGYQYWYKRIGKIIASNWYVSPCLTVLPHRSVPACAIIPVLKDEPYFSARTSAGDFFSVAFVKGEPKMLSGNALDDDAYSRLYNDRISVFCSQDKFAALSQMRYSRHDIDGYAHVPRLECQFHTHRHVVNFEAFEPEPEIETSSRYRKGVLSTYDIVDGIYELENLYGIGMTPFRKASTLPGVTGSLNHFGRWYVKTTLQGTTIRLLANEATPAFLCINSGDAAVLRGVPQYFRFVACADGFVIRSGTKFLTITRRKYAYFSATLHDGSVFKATAKRE